MKYHSRQRNRGVSLLELLIYLALFSIVSVVLSETFLELSRGQGQVEARNEVDSSIRFAMEQIRQDLKRTTSITTPTLVTSSSTLTLNENGTTVTFNIATGTLRRTEGVSSPVPVTGTSVFVNGATFTRFENYNSVLAATTTSVQVLLDMSYNASSTDWTYRTALRTTVGLR